MQRSYEKGVTDEFIEPVTIVDSRNEPVGTDSRRTTPCIFFNYRADRGREMTEAHDPKSPLKLHFTTMTQYDKTLTCRSCSCENRRRQYSGQCFRALNWKNLRVAETEKYAHVTYFFNGGNEKPFPAKSASWCRRPKSRPTI